jgi:hypothetical protein
VPGRTTTNPFYSDKGESMEDQYNNLDRDLDSVAIKAVHGLELCSIMLGLGSKNDSETSYKSSLSSFRSTTLQPDATNDIQGESQSTLYNIPIESCSSSSEKISNIHTPNKSSSLSGVNIVKFDARTDRSQSKAALSKISKELDFGQESEESNTGTTSSKPNLFDFLESDE